MPIKSPATLLYLTGAFVAALCFTLILSCFVGLAHVEANRTDRLQARTPMVVEHDDRRAVALYQEGFDTLAGRQFSVVALAPLHGQSPPPPGLQRWPRPGEAFVSPRLASEGESIRERYGAFGGAIGLAGLADPNEMLVYYTPMSTVDADPKRWLTVAGFGGSGAGEYQWASQATDRPVVLIALCFGVLVAIPALILVAVARRLGRPRGAGRAMPTWIGLLGVFAGTAAGGALAWAGTVTGMVLPVVEYHVNPGDLAAGRTDLLPACMCAFAIVSAMMTVPAFRGGRSRFVPSIPVRRWRQIALAGLILAVAGALSGLSRPGVLLMASGMVVAFAACSPIVAVAFARLDRWMAGWADRRHVPSGSRGTPGSASDLSWQPLGSTAALTTTMAIVLALSCGLQVVETAPNSGERWSLHASERFGTSVVQLAAHNLHTHRDRVVAAFGEPNLIWVSKADQDVVLVGSCPALAALGRMTTCPEHGTPADRVFRTFSAAGDGLVRMGVLPAVRSLDGEVVITSRGDALLPHAVVIINGADDRDLDDLKQWAYRNLLLPEVSKPGQEWLPSYAGSLDAADWIRMFGLGGSMLLVPAMLLATLFALVDPSRRQAVRRRGKLPSLIGVTVPQIAGGILASVAALAFGLALAVVAPGASFDPAQFNVVLSALAASALVAGIIVLSAALSVEGDARN